MVSHKLDFFVHLVVPKITQNIDGHCSSMPNRKYMYGLPRRRFLFESACPTYATYNAQMLKRVAPLDNMIVFGPVHFRIIANESLSCCKNSFETMAMLQLTRLLLNLFFKGIIHFHKTLIHVFVQTIAYNSYSQSRKDLHMYKTYLICFQWFQGKNTFAIENSRYN
jgi:hypothetical protein